MNVSAKSDIRMVAVTCIEIFGKWSIMTTAMTTKVIPRMLHFADATLKIFKFIFVTL